MRDANTVAIIAATLMGRSGSTTLEGVMMEAEALLNAAHHNFPTLRGHSLATYTKKVWGNDYPPPTVESLPAQPPTPAQPVSDLSTHETAALQSQQALRVSSQELAARLGIGFPTQQDHHGTQLPRPDTHRPNSDQVQEARTSSHSYPRPYSVQPPESAVDSALPGEPLPAAAETSQEAVQHYYHEQGWTEAEDSFGKTLPPGA